ncbi:amino acid ABC transporter substrate-binding protein, partial [Streptomyces sp. T21Q-yed]|nr:amino acid ABC transporter substrate-binding protein [Streptomyces sp. T21Q-yed]
MGRRSRGAEAAIAVVVLALSTACGSRLPESDFEHRDRGTPSAPAAD